MIAISPLLDCKVLKNSARGLSNEKLMVKNQFLTMYQIQQNKKIQFLPLKSSA